MSRTDQTRLRRTLRALGPAIGSVPPAEALRAGIGALIGLGVTALFLLSPTLDTTLGLYLVAPFGATSVLVFAVPNSPLAQPWSAVAGNAVSALVAVAVCLVITDPAARIALAVALAIAAMMLVRAVHPPGGAVAMTAAMSPDAIQALGFRFALTPIAAGTLALVLCAILYARMTGRRYPFRQFEEPSPVGTLDPPAVERLGLSEEELTDILSQYRQSLNLGVEDLARLIAAAEMQAATHRAGPLTAEQIMSRDLVTVGPDTRLGEVADIFREHGFTTLPVVQQGDQFLGVIFQLNLIREARDEALRRDRGFAAAMARLVDRERRTVVRAGDIMTVAGPRATPSTPAGALLPMLAERHCDAVPVLTRGRIVGIVTRTDLIAVLARETLRTG